MLTNAVEFNQLMGRMLNILLACASMFFIGFFFLGTFAVFNNEFEVKGFGNELSKIAESSQTVLRSYNLASSYGLFRRMTGVEGRDELVIYGSDDNKDWKLYEFYHKPTRSDKMPTFIAPHQPRLDWQLWFSALNHGMTARDTYLSILLYRLFSNSRSVVCITFILFNKL